MKLPNKKIIFAALALTILTSFSLVKKINAEEILPLTVAPAKQEVLVNPGEKTAVVIKFINQGTTAISGALKAADFIVEDSEGTPIFLEGINNPASPRFAAVSWVELPYDRITIAPKNSVTIQAKINVPQDALAGGRYFGIYFEPSGEIANSTAENGAETPITIRLAGLVFLRVAGAVEESAFVTQLTAPRFLEYGPVSIKAEIKNKGNYHIRPKGTISITSVFGKKIDEKIIKEANIFPDTSRFFENTLGQKWLFGKYKIELTAAYGETGKVLTATVFTWIIPWKLIVIIILTIVIVILLISLLVHRLRKRETDLQEKIQELEEKLENKPAEDKN
jgi:hypothetical protein